MLAELVRAYPGLQDYHLNSSQRTATVKFSRNEDAQLALAGKNKELLVIYWGIGLHKFKVGKEEGTELRVSFI